MGIQHKAGPRFPGAVTARRQTLGLLEGTAIAGAAGAALVGSVVTVGATGAAACDSYPGCLLSPSGLVAGIHVVGAGLLLLLALASLILALAVRSTARQPTRWAVAALLVLVGMAALGSAFAAGALPTSLAPVQYGFLTALVALDVGLAVATHRERRPRLSPHGPGA